MSNFVKLNSLDAFQLQGLRDSCFELATNELENRGIPDSEKRRAAHLAEYLYAVAERWASMDEEDLGGDEYEAIFEEYFTN